MAPIDFSNTSLNAADYAISFARSFEANLHIINVIPPPIIVDDPVLASVLITQTELMESNKQLMKEKIEALSKTANIQITGLVTEGPPADVISEIAQEKKAELIIMGMKGKGKSNSVFGSTVTAVIRKSGIPVLVIPEKASFQTLQNITFASDFDPDVELESYDLLIDLVEKLNIPVYILNIQKKEGVMSSEAAIGKMKTNLAFSKFQPQFQTINERNIEQGINKFIENNHTDLLAMVAHPHNLLERVFGTVHTKEMSYQSKIPLLILPEK